MPLARDKDKKTGRWIDGARDKHDRAYPMLLEENAPSRYSSAADQLKQCYCLRALDRFAALLGLVKLEVVGLAMERQKFITKLPLLDAAVRFQITV